MEEFGAELWDGDGLVTAALVQLYATPGGAPTDRDGTFYLARSGGIRVGKTYHLVTDDGRSGTITITGVELPTGPPVLVVFHVSGPFTH